MNREAFPQSFARLTGSKPFPWQESLFEQFVAGSIPTSATIPTGLGKTAVVAVWLCAVACRPKRVPRRLVYVVNRRTVVDQTTTEVMKWRAALKDAGLHEALKKLPAVALEETESPLALSTLRGQFADNREWSADPARPAVIVGTVDMIGSRLLFSSYGGGFKARPHHAAFLGQDVLLIHDEAHLEPAFQKLLNSIVDEQKRSGDARRLQVLELSATARNGTNAFELGKQDRDDSRVHERLHAVKSLTLHGIADEKKLAEKITELVLALRDTKRAILIFTRHLETVQRVADTLRKSKIAPPPEMLTGTLRGKERDDLVRRPTFQRFLPASNRSTDSGPIADGTVCLIATSAGEVGVNLSADDLVCDLSTFESMAQRFGRVNRFGKLPDSEIHVVYPESFDAKDPLSPARQRTLDLLRKLNGSASPAALGELDPTERAAAFSPEPDVLPATDILFDAWSLTTIRERLPVRPLVAPYLHGVAEWEPPETYVAWRKEVAVIDETLEQIYPPGEVLAEYPLKPHELLRDRSWRVHKALIQLAQRPKTESLPVWLVADDGTITRKKIRELAEKEVESELHDRTILLPPAAGGLLNGILDGSAEPSSDGSEDIADQWIGEDGKALRQRIWSDGPVSALPDLPRMRLVRVIDTLGFSEPAENEDAAPTEENRFWYWFESRRAIEGSNLQRADTSVLLKTHTEDVIQQATAIVEKLGLPEDFKRAIVLAARFHDSGKNRPSWQRGIGNLTPHIPLAKAGRRLHARETGERYRHEFGSLLDVSNDAEFIALSGDEKDLVLHLIAAHHGRARPHFPWEEAVDPNATATAAEKIAAEVPLRFARLQRQYGRWGLAYLESILRAADYAASATPSSTWEEPK